jgi:aminomethyltransferase
VLQPLTGLELGELRYYWFGHGEVASARATISRTGYTGEDGYEIFVPPNVADRVWQALLESGRSADVIPCGLGARDTLRLEAAMRLWGSDIDESTTVLEAGMDWIVGWDKKDFIGREALAEQRDGGGPPKRLVGFEMLDRGIARHGYQVMRGDRPVGVVTSGTHTPFLKKAIGMAYVPSEMASASEIAIDVRGRTSQARIVPLPFYKRGRRH